MDWQKYSLCFRLLSPLHVGFRKVGNLMQTRSYVPGKVLWGALTARLTRNSGGGADGRAYQETGAAINEFFRFSYLYPAITMDDSNQPGGDEDPQSQYPWNDPTTFDYRFLDSYASTTLNYESQTAAEGELREVEFIRPWTRPLTDRDDPLPVFLKGELYVAGAADEKLPGWREALGQIQIGGERGYGWGRVRLTPLAERGVSEPPERTIHQGERLEAHLIADREFIRGTVEPFLGWQIDNREGSRSRWHLSDPIICYAPGGIAEEEIPIRIGPSGIWQAVAL